MRKRTIRSGKDYVALTPVYPMQPNLRLTAYAWVSGHGTCVDLTRGQAEKLRDALTDWLESGAK